MGPAIAAGMEARVKVHAGAEREPAGFVFVSFVFADRQAISGRRDETHPLRRAKADMSGRGSNRADRPSQPVEETRASN